MNNSSLVNNTDRIYGQANVNQPKRNQFVDDQPQFIVWLKIIGLFIVTYGLMVAFVFISQAIEYFSGNLKSDFINGGGVILGLFLLYMIIVGVAWYNGSSKREEMKREAVQEQLRRQRQIDLGGEGQ